MSALWSVPHLWQNAATASNKNDCGQACVGMFVHLFTDQRPTVGEIARATNTAHDGFTTLDDLIRIGTHYGVEFAKERRATIAWYERMLDAGKPVIALVHYGMFRNRPSAYAMAHFLVVIGYDADGFILNDPLQRNGSWRVSRADFKRAISTPSPTGGTSTNSAFLALYPVNMSIHRGNGMNIDPRSYYTPATQLKPYGMARFSFIWEQYKGEKFQDAIAFYQKLITEYRAAGVKVMLVFTQQSGFDGMGYDYEAMDWEKYIPAFRDVVRDVCSILQPDTAQLANEQDALDNRASLVVPPLQYGRLFNLGYDAIKAVAPNVRVITGGYNSGPTRGSQQFKDAKIIKCDGVAFHPYGASAGGLFVHKNPDGVPIPSIDVQLRVWQQLNLPLIISEFGILGQPQAPVERVAAYAANFLKAIAGKVEVACWYGLRDGMDTGTYAGYGVIDSANQVKPALHAALSKQLVDDTPDVPVVPITTALRLKLTNKATVIRLRAEPSVNAAILDRLTTGLPFIPELDVAVADGFTWRKIKCMGKVGWIATEYADAQL